ncbi:MAG: 30S ribosomal protein S7 [Hyphomicrobiales bacterium]
MRRAAKIHKAEVKPDAKYNNVLVTRFINSLMSAGKKSTAERIFYGAMDVVEQKTGQDGLTVLKGALNNVKPVLEVKSRRVGGATYQVPVEVRQDRRTALALRWIISYARSRPDHTMAERLAAEVIAASKNEGGAVKKREDTHKMAEANKAFAHYRW